jgi:outer membrane protein assembly factor BamB
MKRAVLVAVCAAVLSTGFVTYAQKQAGQAHWPQWRGPAGTGVAAGTPPLTWDDATNVRWKIEIPGRGYSTPVIWGDRIYLTTAIPTGKGSAPEAGGGRRGPGGGAGAGQEHDFVVMAFDRLTGKELWRRTATTAVPHEGYHQTYGSFASNSPATDGKRVYASFGSRGLYAFDVDGKPLWQKDFGIKMKMRLQFGEGAATVLHGDRLFKVYDHQEEGLLVAVDAATGKEIWRVARNEGSSWSSPAVVEHQGKRLVVVTATPKAMAFDYDTGKLVWEVSGLGLNPIPLPVQHGDIVYVMSGYRDPRLMAVRLGRTGDLTGTDAIVWEATRGLSYTPSPVLHEGKLYLLTDNGQVSCLDAATGKAFYQQTRLPKPYNFKASPIAAAGRLYLASEDADVIVLKLGETFEVLGTNTLTDQSFIASPIVAGNDLYLRSRTHLFRISEAR